GGGGGGRAVQLARRWPRAVALAPQRGLLAGLPLHRGAVEARGSALRRGPRRAGARPGRVPGHGVEGASGRGVRRRGEGVRELSGDGRRLSPRALATERRVFIGHLGVGLALSSRSRRFRLGPLLGAALLRAGDGLHRPDGGAGTARTLDRPGDGQRPDCARSGRLTPTGAGELTGLVAAGEGGVSLNRNSTSTTPPSGGGTSSAPTSRSRPIIAEFTASTSARRPFSPGAFPTSTIRRITRVPAPLPCPASHVPLPRSPSA